MLYSIVVKKSQTKATFQSKLYYCFLKDFTKTFSLLWKQIKWFFFYVINIFKSSKEILFFKNCFQILFFYVLFLFFEKNILLFTYEITAQKLFLFFNEAFLLCFCFFTYNFLPQKNITVGTKNRWFQIF